MVDVAVVAAVIGAGGAGGAGDVCASFFFLFC